MEGLMCHSFIGGLPLFQDKETIKKCHIAVGTPGKFRTFDPPITAKFSEDCGCRWLQFDYFLFPM
jgi:hypothetical protein